MYARLGPFIHRFRWWIVAAWLVITAASLIGLPNLNTVVSHTKTDYIPQDSSVITASNLAKHVDPKHQAQSTAVIAVHNPHGLTAADKAYFDRQLKQIENNKQHYGVTYVQDLENSGSDSKGVFLSRDGSTEIAMVGLRYDVEDPYGSAIEDYRLCAAELQGLIERGYPRIIELASPPAGSTSPQ
ncbi:MAG: MMPL family transporter [Alicyclobacillus shizuokensis]|nr:MMPL family transporter [Alicyclobacillus shizuokensis]